GTAWSFNPPVGVDACSGEKFTVDILSTVTQGVCPQEVTRTWQITDACGNTSACSQTVTVGSSVPVFLNTPLSSAGQWTPTGELTGSHSAAVLLPDGTVLVAGGSTLAQLYDPTTETWTATGSLATDGFGQTLTLLSNGKVLIA